MNDNILESTLTCPSCGHTKAETMSTDAFATICPGLPVAEAVSETFAGAV